MPSASEILSGAADAIAGVGKKAKTAADALIIKQMDRTEQRDRDRSQPTTEVQQAWDSWMKIRQEGGDDAEARANYEKISNPSRRK